MVTIQEKIKKLRRSQKNPNQGVLELLERIDSIVEASMEDKLSKIRNGFQNKINRIEDENRKITTLNSKLIQDIIDKKMVDVLKTIRGNDGENGEKGEVGSKPIAGIDFPIPENGKDGKDAEDINPQEVAQIILPEISDKITKIILSETPKPKDGSPDTPQEIKKKLETLIKDERLDKSAIKGLERALTTIGDNIRSVRLSRGGGKGGGMGNFVHQQFTGAGPFTLNSKVANGGSAIFVFYNSGFLVKDVHYSVSGNVVTQLLDIDPVADENIDIVYIRS